MKNPPKYLEHAIGYMRNHYKDVQDRKGYVSIVVDGFRQDVSLKRGLKLYQDKATLRSINNAILEELNSYHGIEAFGGFEQDSILAQNRSPERLNPEQVSRYTYASDSIVLGMDHLVRFYQVLSDECLHLVHSPGELIRTHRGRPIQQISNNSEEGLYSLESESSLSNYLDSLFFPEVVMESFALWDFGDTPHLSDYRHEVHRNAVEYLQSFGVSPNASEVEHFPLEDGNLVLLAEYISSKAIDRFVSLVSESVGLQYQYQHLTTMGRGEDFDPFDTFVVDWFLGFSAVNGHDTLMPYAKKMIREAMSPGLSVLHKVPQNDEPLITAMTKEA
tara:strand:+ start:236 stop:1231 length:996 start_codon:yes stop_codon:yes gene_type:complete